MRALYARFGLEVDAPLEARWRALIEAPGADGERGHHYSTDDLGAPVETLSGRFARYRATFGVPAEATDFGTL